MASKKKSAISVSEGELAPAFKPKRKPRGKPFQPKNRHGAAFRWKKGDPSPNPGGRPRSAEISRAARALLAMEVPGDPAGRTFAERIVWQWAREAIRGNVSAGEALADRSEGKPATTISVQEQREDPLAQLIELWTVRVRGRVPEGHVPYRPDLPQLPAESPEATDGESA